MQIYNKVPLSTILWYEIGGVAETVVDITSKEDLYKALSYIEENNISHSDVFCLGFGSNLIFPDEEFKGVILRFLNQEDGEGIKKISDNVVESFAGETLDGVIQFGFDNGFTGLEWGGGLPGTMGAAVRGNVGAFGGEIKDLFHKAHCVQLNPHGGYEDVTLDKNDMDFSYRTSKAKKEKLIVVSAQFELKQASAEELLEAREKYFANITYRQDRHPLDYPNCGSVFKNISKKENVDKVISVWPDVKEMVDGKWHGKVSMGYVIDRLGFKDFRVGNAKVSNKHQNFIVNLGGAKAHDVKEIITSIEKNVQDAFGFTPEIEIEIVN